MQSKVFSEENLDIKSFPVFAFELHNFQLLDFASFPLSENTSTRKTSQLDRNKRNTALVYSYRMHEFSRHAYIMSFYSVMF